MTNEDRGIKAKILIRRQCKTSIKSKCRWLVTDLVFFCQSAQLKPLERGFHMISNEALHSNLFK